MSGVRACALPPEALLRRYAGRVYVDAYCADLPRAVSQADYVAAFYATPLFRAERLVLAAASIPSRAADAGELARGERDAFAAWTVEARAPDQLLLCDLPRNTRSWLMAAPAGEGTRLYFGSAVTATEADADGGMRLRQPYRALLGAHRLYSRALLSAARRSLLRGDASDA